MRHRFGTLTRVMVVAAVLGASLMTPALAAAAAASPSPSTVWLCRPGLPSNPCASPLTATVVRANGTTSVLHVSDAKHAPIDCFYVYPTVSDETTANADLTIQPQETGVAIFQASRFSADCKVYAPMYNQLTLAAISGRATVTAGAAEEAYNSALSGFEDYLHHYNHGRGIVFIGHSQGSAILIQLLRNVVDPSAKLRKQLVSAILLGGNVTVPNGKEVGGSFQHIPACTSARQIGCVMAYSSFLQPPPVNSLFGRAGQGVSALSGQAQAAGLHVLCTNPAALGGGTAPLQSFFPSFDSRALGVTGTGPTVPTPWVTYPGLYTAQCMSAGGATWLQVNPRAGDPRPEVAQVLGPTWGTHLSDVNLSLGNLVSVAASESKAYAAHHHG